MNAINKIGEEQKSLWLKVVSSISEGILTRNFIAEQTINLFGRKVNYSSTGDIAFISGISATGLRATAWITDNELNNNANNLRQAARLHLPIVVVVISDDEIAVEEFISKNAFRLDAVTFSELIDFTIIAHKIAETTLVPGVVVFKGNFRDETINLISEKVLLEFSGNPDDKIKSPTPAQEIIFGKNRRRIVNWFNPDVPVLTGAQKSGRGMKYEIAANEFYFKSAVENFIYSAFDDFSAKTGRKYKPSFNFNRQQELPADVPFSLEYSNFPKHEILVQTLSREFPQLKYLRVKDKSEISFTNTDNDVSVALKNYIDKGPAYSRLSNFLENVMMFYGNEKSEWIADPFQAIPVMPPATANLVQVNKERKQLPVIDYEKFGECTDCMLFCPHAAIMATALSVEEFIKTGIRQALEEGYQFSHIIPLQKNWIKISNRIISRLAFNSYTLKEILPAALHELVEQMKTEGEKKQQLEIELNSIMQFIGDIRIVINDNLFRERNKIDNNSGELLSVAIDVNSCTGCGACAAISENKSFEMEDETPQLKEQLIDSYSLWRKLPDTSFDTINRLIEDKDFSSLAAILLSRNINSTLTGSNKNEDGAGAKTLVHLFTSVTESVVQPAYLNLLTSIEDTLKALLENIRKQLSDALPISGFSNLSELLNELKGEKISLNDLIRRGEKNLKLIDKSVLKRKIDLSDELSELKRIIETGVTGTGRSRYGIILDNSLSSLAEFPYNNFTSPVILFEGSSLQLLSGVIEGHIRNNIDNHKLLRRAALEAQNKYVPSVHDQEIANLTWEKLTDGEKSSIAPVLIFAKAEIFRNADIFSFNELLQSGYPLKIVIVDDAEPGNSNAFAQSLVNFNNCYITKASLVDPEYLFGKLMAGISHSGPALFWLLAPEVLKQNSKNVKKLNSLAQKSRAFTQFDFTPVAGHKLLSSNINIENNVFSQEDWVREKIVFSENGEEKQMDYTITYADWIFTFESFKQHFKIYDEKDGEAVTVENYIKLDLNSRKDKVPVIYRLNPLKKIIRYRVSDFVIRETELALNNWRALRELAGTLTEFPEKLKRKVEQEVSEKYEDEKIKMSEEYKIKINTLEEDYLQKIRQKLKDKLMQLSKTGEN